MRSGAGCRSHLICRHKRFMANLPKAVIDKTRVPVIERSKTQNQEDRDDRGAKKADSRLSLRGDL